jgi:hypothetical protein
MQFKVSWEGSALTYKKIKKTEHIEATTALEALEKAKPLIIAMLSKGLRPFVISKLSIKSKDGSIGADFNELTRMANEINEDGKKRPLPE